jgi:hypothetical protein
MTISVKTLISLYASYLFVIFRGVAIRPTPQFLLSFKRITKFIVLKKVGEGLDPHSNCSIPKMCKPNASIPEPVAPRILS